MTTKTGFNKLNRFTTLPVLLDMLKNRRLVFSNPENWDDENDTELLKIYKNTKNVKTLLALCFLGGDETIHHWKAFACGVAGCCIEFDKAKLKKLLAAHKKTGVRYHQIVYKKLDWEVDDRDEMIPFQKRWPYKFENEFRAIWSGSADNYAIENIDLTMITKITLSAQLFETVQYYLRNILHVSVKTIINPSTIYRNEKWISKFKEKFNNTH
jgi:hypothetical protein